jgi:amino acid adenylation domain-containing protein/non-ribosomal peptide synthase protein (TIGR01720 family)
VLARIWGEVLGAERVGVHDNFFELGGDSILCVQVVARAAQAGIRLTPKQLFQNQTVAGLARVAGTAVQAVAEQGIVTGEVPLTPVQQWFLGAEPPEPQHWNLAMVLEMGGEPVEEALRGTVEALLAHHDALRLRFARGEGGWTQHGAGVEDEVPFETADLSALPAEEREAAFTARATEVQRTLDLENGPLVRFVLFRMGAGRRARLLVVAHHLVMDVVSWGVLAQDLAAAYAQLAAGEAAALPRKSTSFRHWAERLEAHARSGALAAEAAFWTDPSRAEVAPLPRDREGGANTEGAAGRVSVSLEAETTRALLQDVPPVYGTQINDVLLAALAHAFGRWTGRSELLVELEGHGREDLFEDVDISRTVGWFTSLYPVLLSLGDPDDTGRSLKEVKEQLRAVPGNGIGYGLLRYLSADEELRGRLAALPRPEVSFNYLGQLGGAGAREAEEEATPLFAGVAADPGPARSPRSERPHLLGIDAMVADGQLHATWTYSPEAHDRDTVEALAEGYLDALRAIVEHCKDPEAGGTRPLTSTWWGWTRTSWTPCSRTWGSRPGPLPGPSARAFGPASSRPPPGPGSTGTRGRVLVGGPRGGVISPGLSAMAPKGRDGGLWSVGIRPHLSRRFCARPPRPSPGRSRVRRRRPVPDLRVRSRGAPASPHCPLRRCGGEGAPAALTLPRAGPKRMDTNHLSESRSHLSAAKRELLEQRLRGTAKPVARSQIVRRGGGPVFPMSFAQERLWFLDQLEPGTCYYNIPVAARIIANVDVPALERALSEVVRRHEATRTVFRLVDDVPVQIVTEPYEIKLEYDDVRDLLTGPDADAVLRRLVQEEGKKPFDLANGPLFRGRLFRISDEDAALVLTLHHIITDGWSMPLVTHEMEALYDAYRKGLPSPLPELEVQYSDYAAWQREYLTGATLQKQIDYWKKHLGGAPHLELPTDRPRPAVQKYNGDFHRFIMGPEVTRGVQALAGKEHVTVNMIVMAAFNILLQRLSGQDDIVVGTLIGNRNRAETEALIGFFVNTAACRFDLSGDPTFHDFLARVKEVVLDADAHQDLPFEKLVDHLKVERDLSRHPIFQVMYFHHTFVQAHGIEQEGLKTALNVRPLYENGVSLVDMGISKFDIMLATLEMGGVMPSMIEYSTDLFDAETIERFARHLEVLLGAIAADPYTRISELPIVEPAEQARMVAEWNDATRRDFPTGTIHGLFEAQAARTPDAPAIRFGGETLSYRETEERANRLANHLRSLGVGAETRVGVCMERTPEMVVALLAILKAGGAYVPLDPKYPAVRLAHMLEDSRVAVVLTDAGARAALPATTARVVAVDEARAALAGASAAAPAAGVEPENAAYVIYTSGSTGRPKGVEIAHRSTVDLLHWWHEEMTDEDRSAVLASTSISFDVSIAEIFGTLCWGGMIVLVENALSLAELPEGAVVTASMVPTAAAELLRSGGIPKSVRTLNLGGEALPASLARDLYATGHVETIRNLYGPTEDTTYSTCWRVPRDVEQMVVGRPVANTRAYVLDARLRPVPVGVPGELYLAGKGLSRGYAGHPGLTAERYLPNPFGAPGERMYRVLDRVRVRADGELEYLGRTDHMVKIRGHRIELGEIEAALRQHAAVRDAVAAVREDAGQRRLVGYLVPRDGAEAPTVSELRAFLKERVPDYMVPAAFVTLESLPLSPNGKVDRRALPAPDHARPEEEDTFVAAHGAVEETLARIWAEVLRLPQVGVNDNFFELGGDSILSVQVIARSSQAGIRLTPKQMFQHQTIAELARVAGSAAQVLAEQGPVVGELPLTPVEHWFFGQEMEDAHHFNITLLLEARDAVDAAAMEGAVAAVLEQHDALRLRFARGPEGWTQHCAEPGGPVPFEVVDLSAVPADAREAEMTARAGELQATLDVESGPLVRFVLFRMGEGRHDRLMVAAHHLAIDVVSWTPVLEDLQTAYEQIVAGEALKLPRKTTSYRQWATKLVEHARSGALDGEIALWTDPARAGVVPLPRDRQGANTEAVAERLTVALDAETTRALLVDVPPVYSTQINDVLLAALALSFEKWTGRSEVLVDLESHGREDLFEDVDVSRTAGWFTAIHPVHLRVAEPQDVGGAIKTVKEGLRAIPHKGIGYGMLRYLSADEGVRARLAALPQPEVSFNYLGQLGGAVSGVEGDSAPAAERPFFQAANADSGPSRSPRGARPHLLGIDAMVAAGQLHATWTYSKEIHDRATVEALAEGYLDALRTIVEHCKDPEAGGFTPSDFAMAGLDQEGLDSLLAQLGDLA